MDALNSFSVGMVQRLMKRGYSPAQARTRTKALIKQINTDDPDIFKPLVDYGGGLDEDIDIDENDTQTGYVVYDRKQRILEIRKKFGIKDSDKKDPDNGNGNGKIKLPFGRTYVHQAIVNDDINAVIEYLKAHPRILYMRDNNGDTPEEMSKNRNKTTIYQKLTSFRISYERIMIEKDFNPRTLKKIERIDDV